jgi:hypothetical protein
VSATTTTEEDEGADATMIRYDEDNAEDGDASNFVHCRRHAIDATVMRTIAIVIYPTWSMEHGDSAGD